MKTDDLKAQGLTEEQISFVMAEMSSKLKELKRDADTPEERETIEKYIKMIDRM